MKSINFFLQPTEYCDSGDDKVINLAKFIIKNGKDKRENALKFFYWVRDNIKYSVGDWNYKASQTAEIGYGTCTNKANLLIALLRSSKIPAGYGYMKVRGQEYFGKIMLPIFKKKVAKSSVHIFCNIFLNNQWIKCDPSDDKILCDKTHYFNSTTKTVNWNGYSDAMLNLDVRHIIFIENKPIANMDYIFKKKPRNGRGVPIKVANIYLDFLRNTETRFNSVQDVQKYFLRYLFLNYTFYFLLFFTFFWYKNIKNK